jgi:hypothetical protein
MVRHQREHRQCGSGNCAAEEEATAGWVGGVHVDLPDGWLVEWVIRSLWSIHEDITQARMRGPGTPFRATRCDADPRVAKMPWTASTNEALQYDKRTACQLDPDQADGPSAAAGALPGIEVAAGLNASE